MIGASAIGHPSRFWRTAICQETRAGHKHRSGCDCRRVAPLPALAIDVALGPAISAWVVTEFAAALAVKGRMKLVGPDETARLRAEFARLRASSWAMLDIRPTHYDIAADFAGRSDIALRAGDALHLAIAQSGAAELWTMDKGLAIAAERVGVPARLI